MRGNRARPAAGAHDKTTCASTVAGPSARTPCTTIGEYARGASARSAALERIAPRRPMLRRPVVRGSQRLVPSICARRAREVEGAPQPRLRRKVRAKSNTATAVENACIRSLLADQGQLRPGHVRGWRSARCAPNPIGLSAVAIPAGEPRTGRLTSGRAPHPARAMTNLRPRRCAPAGRSAARQ